MRKFNDSSLVSECLNYNLNNEMYMSQYKLDFSPPRRSITTTKCQHQTQVPRKLDLNSTCRCSKCLGI